MTYDNTNKGTLSRNNKKEKPTHPDYKGTINIDGKEYWLSGWIKEGKYGAFTSLSVQPKDAVFTEAKQVVNEPSGNTMRDDFEDDLPFALMDVF
jgi:hypothetical protein